MPLKSGSLERLSNPKRSKLTWPRLGLIAATVKCKTSRSEPRQDRKEVHRAGTAGAEGSPSAGAKQPAIEAALGCQSE